MSGAWVGILLAGAPVGADYLWEDARDIVVAATRDGNVVRAVGESGLFGAFSDALRSQTNLVPRPLDEALAARGCDRACQQLCGTRVECWSERLAPVDQGGPPITLLVDVRAGPQGTVTFMTRALDRATAQWASDGYERALDPGDRRALDEYARDAVIAVMASSHWRERSFAPYGTLRIHGAGLGDTLSIDERVLGATGGGTSVVRNLPIGPRRVVLRRGALTLAEVVNVKRGGDTDVVMQWPLPSTFGRDVAQWSSIAVAATGLAVLIGAATGPRPAASARVCVVPPCSGGGSDGFVGFDDESTRAGFSSAGRPGGPRMVPLGLALLVGGSAAAAGVRIEDHFYPGELTWRGLLAGLAAGAVTLAITSAP